MRSTCSSGATGSPGQAKDLGQQVADFEQGAWEDARYGIIVEGNVAKFSQNPELAKFLLGFALMEARARIAVGAGPQADTFDG